MDSWTKEQVEVRCLAFANVQKFTMVSEYEKHGQRQVECDFQS